MRDGRVSGLLLFRDNLGSDAQTARNQIRRIAASRPQNLPFLFVADEEGGLISQTSRLSLPGGGVWGSLPTPRALGRIGRPSDARWVGRLLGRRLRYLGIRVDLAPSLDLDTERGNPVISTRSFGAEPERVASLGWAFARGLAEAGVAACFKHYPGHGGTQKDSHRELPSMDPRFRRLHEAPFRMSRLRPIDPMPWVMTAHVDWGGGRPATLDRGVLSRLRRICPGALRITDALDMAAVDLAGDAAGEALRAGNDLLLVGRDWKTGLSAVERLESLRRSAAWRRAVERLSPVWRRLGRSGAGSTSVPPLEDEGRLAGLHRAAIRLSHSPETLPEGPWVWIVPGSYPPYADLRAWIPRRGNRRWCDACIRVPEPMPRGWVTGLVNRLRSDPRPVLWATLFRGRPGPAVQAAWRPLLRLPGLRVVAHLLDETWPDAVWTGAEERCGPAAVSGARDVALISGTHRTELSSGRTGAARSSGARRAGATSGRRDGAWDSGTHRTEPGSGRRAVVLASEKLGVAGELTFVLTSGPSVESLAALEMALDRPPADWRCAHGLYFLVDTRRKPLFE